MRTKLFAAAAAIALAAVGHAYRGTTSPNLMPGTAQEIQSLLYRMATLEGIENNGNGLSFTVSMTSQGSFVRQTYGSPEDWSAYDGVEFNVTNSGSAWMNLSLRYDTQNNPPANQGSGSSYYWLEPKSTRSFVMWFNQGTGDFGYRSPIADVTDPYQWCATVNNSANMTTVYRWQMMNHASTAAVVTINKMTLINKMASLNGLIDSYGQYAPLEWSGKIHQDSDLQAQATAESSLLASLPIVGEIGGSSLLTPVNGTGKWRVQKTASGNWFFVHPTGKLFWSMGVNAVGDTSATAIDNRNGLFQQLPQDNPNLGSVYSQQPALGGGMVNTCDFHMANLEKKFGSTWVGDSFNLNVTRLQKWGFNTIGGFSSNQYQAGPIPFTRVLATDAFPTRIATPFAVWRKVPDVFDPSWLSWLQTNLATQLAPVINNPALLGVFVDNEQSWGERDTLSDTYQIPIAVLNAAPSQPAKIKFMASLQAKYSTIAALNHSWQTNYASWATLNQTNGYGAPIVNPGIALDLGRLLRWYATYYYYGIEYALRKDGYTGLYLGSRNVIDWTPDEVIQTATQYVDVQSFNLYTNLDFAFAYIARMGSPVLLSEFSYSCVDRGQCAFGWQIEEGTQRERAASLERYIYQALRTPNIVGVHFFQWVDQPSSGRYFDNQRINCGIVDITDTPFIDLTREFANIGKQVYLRHK